MRAGTLRHRLIIERPDPARDASGDELGAWVRVATVWSRIEPAGGRETRTADQIIGELGTRIVIRWAQGLDSIAPKWRARHTGDSPRVYDIVSVDHVGLGQREIHLMTRSGRTEG